MSNELVFVIQSGGGFLIELDETNIPLLHTDLSEAGRFTWKKAGELAKRMNTIGYEAVVGTSKAFEWREQQ